MSARIAPEPVTIAISPAAQYAPRQTQPTRPVESAGATNADPGRDNAFGRRLSDGDKARPGDRPPGKDPSMLPQALFDAALIAAEFKPIVTPNQPKQQPEEATDATADAEYAAQKLAERILASRDTETAARTERATPEDREKEIGAASGDRPSQAVDISIA